MSKPNNYALIIGVTDYSTYDRTAGSPPGTSDVLGALGDARTWFRQCIAMGFAPERIRVLTSPRLSPEALGRECVADNVGEATRDGIIAGLTWLCEVTGGDEPCSGLLTFTGHGAREGGLLLCPSDVTGSLDEAISVAQLRASVDGRVGERLTALLDCCRAQVGLDREETIRDQLAAKAAGIELPPRSGVEERVIAACRADQTAVTSTFGGEPMGAFTWALASAMGQWKSTREDGVIVLEASYGEMINRARALLGALSFTQEPVLSGPRGVARLPLFHPGARAETGETTAAPNAAWGYCQLDGGTCDGYTTYTFSFSTDGGQSYTEFAQAMATNTAKSYGGRTYQAETEYWYSNAAAISSLFTYIRQYSAPNNPYYGVTYSVPMDASEMNLSMQVAASACTAWGANPPVLPSGFVGIGSTSENVTPVPQTNPSVFTNNLPNAPGYWTNYVAFRGSLNSATYIIRFTFQTSSQAIQSVNFWLPSGTTLLSFGPEGGNMVMPALLSTAATTGTFNYESSSL